MAPAFEDGCDAERQRDHARGVYQPGASRPRAGAAQPPVAEPFSLPRTSITRSPMPANIIYSLAAEVKDPFAKHEPRHFASCVTSSK